jgi:MerR family transcriptional regulator, light-induced transcriptional regulator
MATAMTMREFAAATGVSEGTLRMWEARHGFPDPERLPSGHRRYSQRDLEQVRALLAAREQGLSLAVAVERARRVAAEPRPSLFSALRERFPELAPQVVPKRVLVHLSHAIEDECCLRAQRPLLFGCFQRERFYRTEEARWREMARTAERAVVFADFPELRRPRGGPVEVPIGAEDALAREWAIVCDAPGASACLVGWEPPAAPRAERRFETIWTVDRAVVREAARVCCELVGRVEPELVAGLDGRLADTPAPAGDEVRAAVELTMRMVLYATGQR